MAYNKKNKLKRIIDIQQTYLECNRQHGSTAQWVFENKIKPIYHISRSTFYDYLSINAKLELKKLEEVERKAS